MILDKIIEEFLDRAFPNRHTIYNTPQFFQIYALNEVKKYVIDNHLNSDSRHKLCMNYLEWLALVTEMMLPLNLEAISSFNHSKIKCKNELDVIIIRVAFNGKCYNNELNLSNPLYIVEQYILYKGDSEDKHCILYICE